jgi:hypothetical protein
MRSYNIYKINFFTLAAWLIPKPDRTEVFIILVKAALYPLIFVYNSFLKYRKAKIYQLTITGQVCYLERLLNDRYDSSLRRIRIDDAIWHLPWFLFQEAENKPEYFFREGENNPVWLYTEGEAGIALDDFVVFVPASIIFEMAEMRELLNSFKLFGTKYKIQLV